MAVSVVLTVLATGMSIYVSWMQGGLPLDARSQDYYMFCTTLISSYVVLSFASTFEERASPSNRLTIRIAVLANYT
jgi:hypothetical protein